MVDIHILAACNNYCINCIGKTRDDDCIKRLSDIKKHEKRLKSEDFIALTGGEPTIHSEFFEIMQYINSFGKEMLLLTNARAFSNKDFLERFDSLGLDKDRLRIGTALYGPDARKHESMSRTPGSFEQTAEGVKELIKNGYKQEIRLIVTALNAKYVADTAVFITKELPGIERAVFISMKYAGDAYKNRKHLAIRLSDSVESIIPAVDALAKSGIKVQLFHFPQCVLPQEYRQYSAGKTVDGKELIWAEACKLCRFIDGCAGIWKSYAELYGTEEFGKYHDG